MKILVIEKNQESRPLMEACLTPLGHEFHHVRSGPDGLDYMAEKEIDFIFIEMKSDAESSLETIKSLRAQKKNNWFPIVAMSENLDDDVYASVILAGADAILFKPLSRNRMLMQLIALERIYLSRQSLQADKDLIAANLALLKLSMYDEVTDLASRRYFEETLNKEFRLAKRNTSCLSVIVCEIDSFKRTIESLGTEKSNRLLQALVSAITAIPSRPTDLVCRYGAGQFSIILPATDAAGANHVSEKISRSVQSELMKPDFAALASPIVFDIGYATEDGRYATMNDLIAAAAQSLQAAKKTSFILRNL